MNLPNQARPGFRFLAGVLSVLCFLIGVPVTVYMAIHRPVYRWLDVFTMAVAAVGFASVAYNGRWLCFRMRKDEEKS